MDLLPMTAACLFSGIIGIWWIIRDLKDTSSVLDSREERQRKAGVRK